MSSEAVGTAGNGSGIVEALFLGEEVELEVVWGSGRAFEFEGGWTGGRLFLIGVRSWFASFPTVFVTLKNPDTDSPS